MTNLDKEIINGLIKSCLTINPHSFLQFLKYKNLKTNMPNKLRFYNFYSHMVECLNCNSNKELYYKWTKTQWMKGKRLSLQIFDTIHKYPRLTFIIEKHKDNLYIETLPF